MRTGICLALLLCLSAARLGAQEKPDLTGQWVLESASDEELGAARTLTVRLFFAREPNVRGEPMDVPYVTISRAFQSKMDAITESTTQRIGFSGGTVGGFTDASGRNWRTGFALRWDGDRLAIETGSCSPSGNCSERDEVWSLEAADAVTITTTVRASGDAPTTTTVRYRRVRD
jgi:hypothetical protein